MQSFQLENLFKFSWCPRGAAFFSSLAAPFLESYPISGGDFLQLPEMHSNGEKAWLKFEFIE